MRTDTPTSPAPVDDEPGEDIDTAEPDLGSSPVRRVPRAERRAAQRERRGLLVAVLLCALVPSAVVLTLWRNLTEPFWFNEQWRAYYISNPGNWWEALKSDGAPFPAGWYFLERISGVLFGSTELVLRLPTALFLPIGCVLLMLLARRWMSTPAAVVVALVGALTGTLVSYAIQVSEYQLDAAAVVAVVLLREIAWEADRPTWRSARVYLGYGGIALACVFSTPAVFIAGPLLLLDALRLALRRTLGPQLVAAVTAGVIVLAHLVVFVLPQSTLRTSSYWDQQFLPHHGIGGQVAFVWDGLRGFVNGVFTSSPQSGLPGLLLGPGWSWVLTLVFGVLLCLGVVEAARSQRGRTLLFAIVASQVLTLVASYLRYWPFGFVRTNFYLIPLLMLLAGIGGVRAARFGLSVIRPTTSRPTAPRVAGPVRVAGAALCVLIAVGVALAAVDEVGAYRQTRGSTSAPQYGAQIGTVIATVRDEARPGAAVVVTGGVMTTPGWRYYQYEYAGKATQTGQQIPVSHVDFPVNHGSPGITAFVNRLNPSEVFLYVPFGTTGPELGQDTAAIARGRVCHHLTSQGFSVSGQVIILSCTPR